MSPEGSLPHMQYFSNFTICQVFIHLLQVGKLQKEEIATLQYFEERVQTTPFL